MFGDSQNQGNKAADKGNKKTASSKSQKSAANDTAASSTGTVFAPAAAVPVDPLVNPYDLATDTNAQAASDAQTASPPPVFAETTPANAPAQQPAAPAVQPAAAAPAVSADQANDLLTIKQQALQNLTPLIDKLEQTPEDKFRTMMMLLQASDNPELVKNAYEAAQAISDEKVKAQALLDVVNEINYFTQKSQ